MEGLPKKCQGHGQQVRKIEVDSRLYGVRSRYVTSVRRGSDGGSAFGYTGTPTAPSAAKTYFFSLMAPMDAQLGIITPSGLTSPMNMPRFRK